MSFDDELFGEAATDPADKSWVGWIFAGLLGVVVVALAGYWFLGRDNGTSTAVNGSDAIPLLKADRSPTKKLPKNAGGMKVPFQDKLVYERVENGAIIKVKERLLPRPEEPIKAGERFAKLLAQTAAARKKDPVVKKLLLPKKPQVAPSPGKRIKTLVAPVSNTSAKTVPKPVSKPNIKKKAEVSKPVKKPAPAKTAAKKQIPPLPKAAKPKIAKVDKTKSSAKVKLAAKTVAKPTVKKAPAKKVPVKKVAAAKLAKGKYTVQIAAFRSRENAERGWRALQKKHRGLLAKRPHSVAKVNLKKKGVYFRLRAGSFAKRRDANFLCGKLKAAKQSCITVVK